MDKEFMNEIVVLNLKTSRELRVKFTAATKAEGMDMSGVLRNFMIRTIREVSERSPEAFQNALSIVLKKEETKKEKSADEISALLFDGLKVDRLNSNGTEIPDTDKRHSRAIKRDIEDATKDAIERTKRKKTSPKTK